MMAAWRHGWRRVGGSSFDDGKHLQPPLAKISTKSAAGVLIRSLSPLRDELSESLFSTYVLQEDNPVDHGPSFGVLGYYPEAPGCAGKLIVKVVSLRPWISPLGQVEDALARLECVA